MCKTSKGTCVSEKKHGCHGRKVLSYYLPAGDGKLAILNSLEGVLGLLGDALAEFGHCIPELVEPVPEGLNGFRRILGL